jgi:hypothetical protein
VITPDSGGLAELARAATLGARPYNRSNRRHHFEITYTPTNITVFVDGVQQFNLNAPTGTTFPNGTLGLFEQGQDGGPAENAFAFFDVRDIGTPAPTPGPDLNPAPAIPYSVARLDVPSSTTNGASTWQVTATTAGPGATTLTSPPNVGDVALAVGGIPMAPDVGVLLATVSQNGPRANGANSQYAGVEAAAPSGFSTSTPPIPGTGLATYSFTNGGEWNVNVATAHFPYSAGFRGGYVLPDGLLAYANPGTNYTLTQRRVPLPTIVKYDAATPPAFQNVVTNVRIGGENANTDGLLFAIGTSNEPGGAGAAAGGNYASVSPLADGSWNVAVRDASQAHFGGPDTFEQDDFAFVYLEGADLPGSVGGRVTGLGPGSVPTLAQTWGSFTMTRTGTGRYKVTVLNGPTYDIDILSQALTGETSPQTLTPTPVDSSFSFAYVPLSPTDISDGMLLLMPNDSITLSDGTVAPLNYFMTYEAGVPIPEPAAAGLLAGAGGLLLARRRRRGAGRGLVVDSECRSVCHGRLARPCFSA